MNKENNSIRIAFEIQIDNGSLELSKLQQAIDKVNEIIPIINVTLENLSERTMWINKPK